MNGGILDLVLSNESGVRIAVSGADPLSTIDPFHPPLLVTISNFNTDSLNNRPQLVYNFSKAPYSLINNALSSIDWHFIDLEDLDSSVGMLYDCLFQVIDIFVPKEAIYSSSFPN